MSLASDSSTWLMLSQPVIHATPPYGPGKTSKGGAGSSSVPSSCLRLSSSCPLWVPTAVFHTSLPVSGSTAAPDQSIAAISAAVGLSRVYLRVHYVSDVNSGAALAAAAFALCGAVALLVVHFRDNEAKP